MPLASVRLYVILARKSSQAVIFRRGPSKQVLTLLWDTSTHKIQPGQWFKGRIYERRCDLSPSGERLIYLAANQRPPLYAWTAVSRPPYLTAIALWPTIGTWGGGGLFYNERVIELNHLSSHLVLDDKFKIPRSVTVRPLGEVSGRGEDNPIWSTRLLRDGWVLRNPGSVREYKFRSKIHWEFEVHQVWVKTRKPFSIEMRIIGMAERDGPWYVVEHRVLDADGHVLKDLGRADWADWSRHGELLFAREGRLFAIPVKHGRALGKDYEVLDLRNLKFENVEAPPAAKKWDARLVR